MGDPAISQLVNAIRAKQCVPFIGAGLSKASGMPLWNELIGQMKPFLLDLAETSSEKEEETQYLDQANYLDVATRFKFKAGLGSYHQFLQERYRFSKSQPSEAHHALARIRSWPFVITTNFDKLLEASFTQPRLMPPAIVTEPDELIISIRSGEFFVLKLHGDIDRPQSIVLTRDEYDQFINSPRGQLLLDTLRQQLMFRTVLYIGFGLTDPNFLRVFGEVGWLARGYQGDAFSIMAHTTKPEREEWQRRRLRIISLSDYEELTNFLDDLANKVIGIGSNVVVVNALGQGFDPPKEFLTTNPFFQISSRWPNDFVREQLGTSQSGFSAGFLDSEEIWEPYKTTFSELGKTNHILMTITQHEIYDIPESFWPRMPCDRDVLLRHVEQEKKTVFGVKKANGLYTLLVAANGDDSLRTALADFLSLGAIP
jgi:SIR2-like protein